MFIKIFKKQILKEIESILGYCGVWDDKDIITCEKKTGHATSMSVKTFKENFN